ncbi:ATP-binding protein [Sphaerisporangium sp. NPDC088356]|uniref:ATP-binding protein n=1 Tax=Sphaerisporangium sp. NPDC088356 TaxID=3154871 RepID=UPI0034279A9F
MLTITKTSPTAADAPDHEAADLLRRRLEGSMDDVDELIARTARPVQTWRASWVLPNDDSSVPRARHLVRAQLAEWGFREQSDTTELLATELVTNALRHAWGEPVLTLLAEDGTLRCEVEDDNPDLPRIIQPDEYDETGRGLYLVGMLSCRWGFDPRRTGKVVWFEVPVHQN